MQARLTTRHDLKAEAQSFVATLAATWGGVRMAAAASGLGDVAVQWQRHVRELEESLFPGLVAHDQAADAPVGFCMAEHAVLSVRLASLEPVRPTPEWLREADRVISGLVQHLFLEARILQPFVDRVDDRPVEACRDGRPAAREEA